MAKLKITKHTYKTKDQATQTPLIYKELGVKLGALEG